MSNAQVASARDVALAIERRLPGIGEAKLHKLLYYVQGYHLAWEQGRVSSEEQDCAGRVGRWWYRCRGRDRAGR